MTTKRHLLRSSAGIDHYLLDEGNGNFRVASQHDVAPMLEWNKAAQNHNDGYSPTRELRRFASVPFAIMLKWLNEEGWWAMDFGHDPDVARKLAEKLNSSDYAYLRTADGQVGVSNGVLR